ncbi:MAG TPA: helix-turn-helix domain-containing protein, partial [Paracoccaceae bacterium]|nr:helix-turn-helix domain-containing protein [Paracoccaceae bacterium]
TRLILELFRLNGRLLAAGDALTADLGLTSARWKILGALGLADRPLTVPQIARRMGLTRQAVQRIAHDLAGFGMVEFAPNPDHQGSPLLQPSSQGAAALDTIGARQAEWAHGLAVGLGTARLAEALALLETLRLRLEAQDPPPQTEGDTP